ncbi:MAG: flagellin [Opitutaceae bacterium]|nr:flagellin [Opitutaceae bacterium]
MSVINTNIQAIESARDLSRAQDLLNRSLSRLSSGSKLVDPSDDPAGLGVSQKYTAQNQRVTAATTNVQNATSYAQAADGMLDGLAGILARMSELAVLSQDPTKADSDVALYQEEFQGLQDQLRATIGGTTAEIGGTADISAPLGTFNGVVLFGPNASGYQVALGDSATQTMTIPATNLRTGAMLNLIQQDGAGRYILSLTSPAASAQITDANQQVAANRASLGAAQSRLELAATTLKIQGQNFQSAISQLTDVDVATESTQLAKYNILVQAGTAMLAQANLTPQAVLKLLDR